MLLSQFGNSEIATSGASDDDESLAEWTKGRKLVIIVGVGVGVVFASVTDGAGRLRRTIRISELLLVSRITDCLRLEPRCTIMFMLLVSVVCADVFVFFVSTTVRFHCRRRRSRRSSFRRADSILLHDHYDHREIRDWLVNQANDCPSLQTQLTSLANHGRQELER